MATRRRRPRKGDTQELALLRQRLLDNAHLLAAGLEEAVAESALRERASALGTLVDRLIRLQQLLQQAQEKPDGPTEEQVVRVEYQYPDGTAHDAPPWANADYGFQGALPSGRLRKTFRKDGGGEVADP